MLSRDKIINQVGLDCLCEELTVDMHIKTLRQKLGEAGYIKTVRNVGYMAE